VSSSEPLQDGLVGVWLSPVGVESGQTTNDGAPRRSTSPVVIDGLGTGDAHHAAQCPRGDDGVIG